MNFYILLQKIVYMYVHMDRAFENKYLGQVRSLDYYHTDSLILFSGQFSSFMRSIAVEIIRMQQQLCPSAKISFIKLLVFFVTNRGKVQCPQ